MRPIIILTAATLAIAALAGCDARSVTVEVDPSKITYSRDVRTNLCQGAIGRAAGDSISDIADSFSVYNVPCSPEVMALVPRSQGGGGR